MKDLNTKDFNMKENCDNYDGFDIALIVGIVILALNGSDGWGWLTAILIFKKL
jgi:hypothetical protein